MVLFCICFLANSVVPFVVEVIIDLSYFLFLQEIFLLIFVFNNSIAVSNDSLCSFPTCTGNTPTTPKNGPNGLLVYTSFIKNVQFF